MAAKKKHQRTNSKTAKSAKLHHNRRFPNGNPQPPKAVADAAPAEDGPDQARPPVAGMAHQQGADAFKKRHGDAGDSGIAFVLIPT
jgi:hypothetical protein